MSEQCAQLEFPFQGHFSRRAVADFEGGEVTSDGGAVLLREVDLAHSICERFAACFEDHRDPARTRFPLGELLRQRLFALALGYEDVVDHEELRRDPLFALLAGRADLAEPLAGKSTLNRLEVSASREHRDGRYHRIEFVSERFQPLLHELFFESYKGAPPAEVVLDLDATDSPIYGDQEQAFFHAYYDHYCYLPLYVFSGDHLLHAELRPSNIDPAKGSLEALAPIVREIKKRWPSCRIIVRGDSGFCRDWLMSFCEQVGASYIFGIAKNTRLLRRCAREQEHARRRYLRTKKPARFYKTFGYRAKKSWSARRRIVAKCEHLEKGANPRFVVTNLLSSEMASGELYERGYCPRGDMENRIKEQTDLFAGRMSCSAIAANQLRLAISSIAYELFSRLRRALAGTELERAQPHTIRIKLLKIGARILISTRRFLISFASGYPYKHLFERCLAAIHSGAPPGQRAAQSAAKRAQPPPPDPSRSPQQNLKNLISPKTASKS